MCIRFLQLLYISRVSDTFYIFTGTQVKQVKCSEQEVCHALRRFGRNVGEQEEETNTM